MDYKKRILDYNDYNNIKYLSIPEKKNVTIKDIGMGILFITAIAPFILVICERL